MPKQSYRPPVSITRSDYLHEVSDAEFREAIYALVQSAGRLLACRDAFGAALGLTPPQFTVLMGVAWRQGETGATIKQIAAHISLASTHVTTEVGRLVRKGLLVKYPNAEDGRSVLVRLSPLGQAEIERVTPLVRAVNDILFADISFSTLLTIGRGAKSIVARADSALLEIRRLSAGGMAPEQS